MNNKLELTKILDKQIKSAEEVSEFIKEDFRIRGITYEKAAEKLGIKRQVVSTQLSNRHYLGGKSARKYSEAFGYCEPFLLYGMGTFYKDPKMDKTFRSICGNKDVLKQLAEKEEEAEKMKNKISALEEKLNKCRKELEETKKEMERKDGIIRQLDIILSKSE